MTSKQIAFVFFLINVYCVYFVARLGIRYLIKIWRNKDVSIAD